MLINLEMLVIHPKDKGTQFLSCLYENRDGITMLGEKNSQSEIRHHLNHLRSNDTIMLLGHGNEKGLLSRENDKELLFDKYIISHHETWYLRKYRPKIIGLFCYAYQWAQNEGLHGLFIGMVISEMEEADFYGINTTEEEIQIENFLFARRLNELIRQDTEWSLIPSILREMDSSHTELTNYNYSQVFYL